MMPQNHAAIYLPLHDSYTSVMDFKELIREKALELGFEDAGFCGLEPMQSYLKEVASRPPEMYGWADTDIFSVVRGASPAEKHAWGRSMLVLARSYFRMQFPEELEGLYGRAYLMDERKAPGPEMLRLAELVDFLDKQGISCVYDGEIPARMAAARAGLVTYGKNCFVFSNNSVKNSSWLEIVTFVLDAELEPDEPSVAEKCPPKCGNRCMEACPTGAIYGDMKMNPTKCIAFNSYYGADLTPLDLREAMGTWIYGCDVCQEACPRNKPWMRQEKPLNEDLDRRKSDYLPSTILQMDQTFYEEKIWPRYFYISRKRIDKWQMNAARVLGNTRDTEHVSLLARSLQSSPYGNVRAMSAWALGRIGGKRARQALEKSRRKETGLLQREIDLALEKAQAR